MTTKATPHPYLVLALVCFGVFISAHDLTVISTMLPQMIFDFEIPMPGGLDDASWIVSAYLITHVVAMPLMGRISDIYGRRFIFISCMAIFALGSFMVAQATTLNFLIFSRVIQAIGGGGVVPVAMAVIGDIFPEEERAFALGILGTVDTFGWIIGPMYGAFWVNYFNWHDQFYFNIPISFIAIIFGWFLLRPLTVQTDATKSLDWGGAILLSLALTLLNIGLANSGGHAASGPSFDFSAPRPTWQTVAPYFISGFIALAMFVGLERRTAKPLLDVTMFTVANFTLACLINFVVGMALMIAMVGVPLFVNGVLASGTTLDDFIRTAALNSGQILTAMTAGMAATSLIGGWLCTRFGYRLPIISGLLVMGYGFYLMNTWSTEATYPLMAWHLLLTGLGFGLVIAPVGTAVINAVPAESLGIASSMVLILRLMGMSVGLSSLTAWGLHRYDVLSQLYPLNELGLHIAEITAQIMNEVFLGSALLALLAIGLAIGLKSQDFRSRSANL